MIIKTLELGQLDTNCYIIIEESSGDCAVIDPGGDASRLLDYLDEVGAHCRAVLLTHGHFDHTGAVEALMSESGAPLYMNKKDDGVTIGGQYYQFTAPEGTNFYAEGDSVCVGSITFTVMETPGHTPGSVCLVCRDSNEPDSAVIFTGDTLFRDSCGRTDFPNGSPDDMLKSLKRLFLLTGDYEVYPGHMGATTLERERHFNYFMAAAMRGESI